MEYIGCIFLVMVLCFVIKLFYLESVKDCLVSKNVIIYGVGVFGLIVKWMIEKDMWINKMVVGFIDDNKKFLGICIEGKCIWYSFWFRLLLKEENVEEVIVVIQYLEENQLWVVIEFCLEEGVVMKCVLSVESWINGEFFMKVIQNVCIEDLLGRKFIVLNKENILCEFFGKVILIMGVVGFIGSGFVWEIVNYLFCLFILFDQVELLFYEIQQEIFWDFFDLLFEVVIGDICNLLWMGLLFEIFWLQEVFYVVVYKYVFMMEDNFLEVVQINICGIFYVVSMVVKYGVWKFVMVFIDKVVNLINVMGVFKWIVEMVVQYFGFVLKIQFIII